MTTDFTALALESPNEQRPSARIGYVAGGIMILTAAALWLAAYGQLRFLSPPFAKLLSSNAVKVSERERLNAIWSFPWRGTGGGTARAAALALVCSVLVCATVRTWWAWGATLVAAPLLANWYITLCLLMPAVVFLDKMRF